MPATHTNYDRTSYHTAHVHHMLTTKIGKRSWHRWIYAGYRHTANPLASFQLNLDLCNPRKWN